MASLDQLKASDIPATYPYKTAHLVIPKTGSKDTRWKISFWVYDVQKGKMTRILDRSINKIPDLQERKRHALLKIKKINELLRSGYHIDRGSVGSAPDLTTKLIDALGIALESKKALVNVSRKNAQRSSTFEFYKKQLATFDRWLNINGNHRMILGKFTRQHAEKFMEYVDRLNISASTYNHHRSTLHNLFNVLLDKEMITSNPFSKIKNKRRTVKKNLPFSPDQLTRIMHHIKNHYPEMTLPCMWVYYTFLRPNEMAHLQVQHIGMYHPCQIYLPSEFSKNGQERHIPIHPDLQDELDAAQIQAQPPDYFLFSKGFQPGATFLDPGNFSNRFNARVKKPLGLPDHLTFYNFKHTGVQMAYYSGISKAEIQVIMGHMNNSSFESYMQGLGIHDFQAFTRLMPSLGSSI